MSIRTHRRVAAAAVVALAGLALTMPAANAAPREPDVLQAQVNAIRDTGSVAVVAEVTDQRGHRYATAGQADTATGTPAQPYDRFRVGSTTKTFVATVALQLIGEGRLSLEDTVEHWLPGVVSGNGNDGGKITVRELLQHTSGLQDYSDDLPLQASAAGFLANRLRTYTAAQLVAIAMRHAPSRAPGATWSYSNTNYVLAGMIINKVTGHDWRQEVNRRVIQPLDLRNTSTPGADPHIDGPHLNGYSSFGAGPVIDTTVFNPSAADSAGEIVSTTADLTTFYSALVAGRLLGHAELAEMESTMPATEFDPFWPGVRYGLGLMWVPLTCGGGYYSHGGDVPGYSTRDGVTPDGQRAAVAAVTGDLSTQDLRTQRALNSLVDQELCSANASHGTATR